MASGWAGGQSRTEEAGSFTTHNLRVVILVCVRLHVPDDLVGKKLRELRRLQDVAFDVAQRIVPKGLHDLRHVEEGDIHRVALQCSHGVLDKERVVLVHGQEVRHGSDWVHRRPEEEILQKLIRTTTASGVDTRGRGCRTFSWKLTSAGTVPSRRTCSASGQETAFAGAFNSSHLTSLWIRGDWNLVVSSIARDGSSDHAVRTRGTIAALTWSASRASSNNR